METMEMPSKQVLSFGRQAARWLLSMGTTVPSCCVRFIMEQHTGLTQTLNYSMGGEVTDMDIYAPDLLYLMSSYEKEKINATQIKAQVKQITNSNHLVF